MTTSKLDLRNQLRLRYGGNPLPLVAVDPAVVEPERAFVTHAKSGRTVITAPVREVARANVGFTYLRGRFVEADHANDNGALWTTEDLQMGGATVAGGPLNWLHDDRKIIGSLLQGELVYPSASEQSALDDSTAHGNHIVADAAVWRFLFPEQTATIEEAALDNSLYYSMECVSREVTCLDVPGRPGCGVSFPYAEYDAGRTCSHLRERSSMRRFVDPVFLGGAVIVPPVLPGWKGAEATVLRQASSLVDEHGQRIVDDHSHDHAMALATAVLQWANRE
jgi:hypothetical protein